MTREAKLQERQAHKRNRIRMTRADVVYQVVIYTIVTLFTICCVIPLLYVIGMSLTSEGEMIQKNYFVIIPEQPTLKAYEYVFNQFNFWNSMGISVARTILGVAAMLVFVIPGGYIMAKREMPGQRGIMIFFIITMLFSAGIDPTFVWLRTLNLYNNIWCLILLSLNNVFNMLLYKTNFEGIPSEIEEAAMIDGASSLTLFYRIVIPMTLPVIASCVFFMIVSTWNSYGSAILFISDTDQMPLAQFLYRLVTATEQSQDNYLVLNSENINAATIIISVIPILCVYPFIMNYMKSGLTIGSVKV